MEGRDGHAAARTLVVERGPAGIPMGEREATDAYDVLVREAGAPDEADARARFVRAVSGGTEEYRFGGSLGFGGKFRNDGQGPDARPHVTCYPEDATPERIKAIAAVNAALRGILRSAVPSPRGSGSARDAP